MTDKRSVNNITNTICTIVFFLFAGLFLTIKSLAAEGVDISTPSNFILMSSGGSNNLTASGTNGHWNTWDPGSNVWYDSNGIPYYQTVATGETFTGPNDLLGDPLFAPVAAAGTSDFYGTTTASTSSNLLGGSREYNADNFNGNFTADASGLTTSYIDIHDSNFAASKTASVTANNGTVMEMYDNNFNGSTTINAASGGTVNVQIGNSTEMATLNTNVDRIRDFVSLLWRNITTPIISTSSTDTYVVNGVSRTYGLNSINIAGTTYYCNFFGLLRYYFNQLCYELSPTENNGTAVASDPPQKLGSFNSIPVVTHRSPYSTFSYDSSNDVISENISYRYFSFSTAIINILVGTFKSYINANIQYLADTWYRWYNPNISLANSQFWIAYNTDTGEIDHVNLSTVLYYITWYLGQLYDDGTNVTQNMQQMTQDIGTAAATFQDLNQKEQAAINQIQTGFETFLPDPTEFQSFRAITWCSNYLQQIYLALGAYGQVIFIALLFGVCLQFIGYFRYK